MLRIEAARFKDKPTVHTGTRYIKMEMKLDNPLPNFLRIAGQRATFEYRGVRRVCRRCNLEGHYKAQCTTPHCERCATFGHATNGCTSDCRRCGGAHATVDCTARKLYSTVTAAPSSHEFPALPSRERHGNDTDSSEVPSSQSLTPAATSTGEETARRENTEDKADQQNVQESGNFEKSQDGGDCKVRRHGGPGGGSQDGAQSAEPRRGSQDGAPTRPPKAAESQGGQVSRWQDDEDPSGTETLSSTEDSEGPLVIDEMASAEVHSNGDSELESTTTQANASGSSDSWDEVAPSPEAPRASTASQEESKRNRDSSDSSETTTSVATKRAKRPPTIQHGEPAPKVWADCVDNLDAKSAFSDDSDTY